MAPSSRKSPVLRWRWLLPVTVLVVAFHFSPFGAALDRAFFDAASRHPPRPPPVPPNSAFVLVDQHTMDVLGREPWAMRWPFPRLAFAALIAALDRAGAGRIVIDLTFFDQAESAEQDLVLAATAAAARQTVLGATTREGPVFWNEEFRLAHPDFFHSIRTGNVEFVADDDGIARRYDARGSLAAAALSRPPDVPGGLLRWRGGLESLGARGVPLVPAVHFIEAGLPMVDRLWRQAPDFSPGGFARGLAAEPGLKGGAFDLVRGRTVFVGTNVSGTFDVKPLPVGKLEPGVLLHWTAWANLVSGGFIRPLGRPFVFGVSLLAGAAVLFFGKNRTSLFAPVMAAGIAVFVTLGGAYAALSAGWFLAPAMPVSAVALVLLGVVAESYWLEQARKREIQAMFGAYVDPGVVAQLVREPDSIRLGGERREATVFFSDLAGFTDLSEKLRDRPELMVEIVNAYLEETSECLLNHGAYVDKYIGDAVMAVFGAPQALPDHALAACRAALAAQRLLTGINSRYADATGVRLAVRIGLNTGEMIVGNLGSSRKKNYTVMGDAVNLASRLEAANKAFGTGILLGEETARRVQGALVTRPLARLRVKGKKEAVEVHALLGAPEDLPARQREFVAAYRRGYDAYAGGRFAAAVAALARANGIMPGDLTTGRLLEECARYSQTPPPAGWEPILTLESK